MSPFVRKVLVALNIKSIPYQIDPLIPFYGNSKFEEISPMRIVPILLKDDLILSDSSVICQYLEDKYPSPSIFPTHVEDRAKARWIEEFADTRMADVIIWKLYNETLVKKSVWKTQQNKEIIEKALNEEIPQILDYLETKIIRKEDEFLFSINNKNSISLADISIATLFRNASFAKFAIDQTKWPKCANYINKVLSHKSFSEIRKYEDLCLKTRIPLQKQELLKIGAPIFDSELWAEKPKKGVFNKSVP